MAPRHPGTCCHGQPQGTVWGTGREVESAEQGGGGVGAAGGESAPGNGEISGTWVGMLYGMSTHTHTLTPSHLHTHRWVCYMAC